METEKIAHVADPNRQDVVMAHVPSVGQYLETIAKCMIE
jgi:hypothetical protein